MKTYRYKVDFSEVKHFIEIHEVLKRNLDFPDYYSGTLDGLWDCLTDMLGGINYIEIHGFDTIKKHILKKARQYALFFKKLSTHTMINFQTDFL